MAPFKEVADYCADELGFSFGIAKLHGAHLRKAGILPPSKRGFGALELDTTNAVDLMASLLLAPTNLEAIETVSTIRSRRLTSVHFNSLSSEAPPEGRIHAAFSSVRALGIGFLDNHTVGSTLDRVVNAMRSGAFANWAGAHGDVIVDFHDSGRGTLIYFDRHCVNEAAVFSFDEDKNAPPPPVERMVRVNGRVLRGLATVLGPIPETAIPPPPY